MAKRLREVHQVNLFLTLTLIFTSCPTYIFEGRKRQNFAAILHIALLPYPKHSSSPCFANSCLLSFLATSLTKVGRRVRGSNMPEVVPSLLSQSQPYHRENSPVDWGGSRDLIAPSVTERIQTHIGMGFRDRTQIGPCLTWSTTLLPMVAQGSLHLHHGQRQCVQA